MKKFAVLTIVLLAIATSGCGPSPEELTAQFMDAINSQDTESALELLSEDAVLQVDGTLSRTGKAEIENWLEMQADLRHRIEGDPAFSESGVSIESCSISSDKWLYFGVNPMSGTCEVALEGGLVTNIVLQIDDDSKARLSDSQAATTADFLGIWMGGAPLPGGDPHVGEVALYHLQFAEDGSARLAVTPDDLSIAPDSNHPGASLTWTYEDYVLTVQNEGSATEGYCQDQDVGTYLIKNVKSAGGGRLQFNLISDSCVFRAATLQRVAAPWDPYVP